MKSPTLLLTAFLCVVVSASVSATQGRLPWHLICSSEEAIENIIAASDPEKGGSQSRTKNAVRKWKDEGVCQSCTEERCPPKLYDESQGLPARMTYQPLNDLKLGVTVFILEKVLGPPLSIKMYIQYEEQESS